MYSFRAASASRCRPSAGVALTHAATQTAALQRVWSSYTVANEKRSVSEVSQQYLICSDVAFICCTISVARTYCVSCVLWVSGAGLQRFVCARRNCGSVRHVHAVAAATCKRSNVGVALHAVSPRSAEKVGQTTEDGCDLYGYICSYAASSFACIVHGTPELDRQTVFVLIRQHFGACLGLFEHSDPCMRCIDGASSHSA